MKRMLAAVLLLCCLLLTLPTALAEPTEPEEEVISFDGGLGLPEMDLGTTITIDPMPEGVTDVAAPGPGEKTPGE